MNPTEKQFNLEQRIEVRAYEKIVAALVANEVVQSFKIKPLTESYHERWTRESL